MDAGRLTVCVFHPDWTMAALLLYLFTVSDKGIFGLVPLR